MKLPGADRAVVDTIKLQEYLLSPTHPVGRFKAAFFAALGFRVADWELLREALLTIARSNDADSAGETPYGEKYEVRATLSGPGGRAADIVTVWIVRTDEEIPRLVTAYPA